MSARTASALAAAVLVLLLAVVGLAARDGSYTTPVPTPAAPTSAVPFPPTLPSAEPTASPTEPDAGLPRLHISEATSRLLLVVVVSALAVLVALLVRSLPRRLRRLPAPTPVVGTSTRPLAEAAQEALDQLEQPDAREAVVRSWLLLGRAAAAIGMPADPAETATEYADRLTVDLGLIGPELHRLAELYREARFSRHPVTEEQRTEARELLQTLGTALGGVPT